MFTKILLNSVFALTAFLPLAQARATITFEDVSPTIGAVTAPFTSGGYTFSYTSINAGGVHGVTNLAIGGAFSGSNYLEYEVGSGTETFASNSGLFNLTSLDLGGRENFLVSADLQITGTRFDNTTVTYDAVVTPGTIFKTFVLPDFTNLSSVTLGYIPGGGYMGVDNIQVSPVPEPQTYAMLLMGLAMLTALTRNRKTTRASDTQA
jgi:hypothetical protein